jgi:hypothetical protein
VVLDYQVDQPPEGAVLNVAIVQRGLDSEIARGENAGRTLRQDNVVRAFTSVGADTEGGRMELTVPPDLDPRSSMVVGYVQESGNRAVIGATAIGLSTA